MPGPCSLIAIWDPTYAADQGTRDRGTSRPDWVFMLTRDQIQDYTMEQVLGGTDGWNPGA